MAAQDRRSAHTSGAGYMDCEDAKIPFIELDMLTGASALFHSTCLQRHSNDDHDKPITSYKQGRCTLIGLQLYF
jgi:hypothetical protein